MTLAKAIRIKTLPLEDLLKLNPDDIDEAERLSLEALKRVEHTRHEAPEFVIPLLPGETEN